MKKRLTIAVVLAGLLAAIPGCYYTQAARGQFELMRKREPIAEVIGDPETPAELSARLALVADAREFSVTELGLPDNKSYRSYADLEREYVVWNVIAAPEFSLDAKTWCYPIVGCVGYRGYFKKEAAEREAAKLAGKGFDVHLGGVTAYSTLGKFSDPVLNTMMRYDDTQLVAVLFHELAHQLLYIKDDTSFNESFASAVEEFGVQRWLRDRGHDDDFDAYEERRRVTQAIMETVEIARDDLRKLYGRDVSEDEKRVEKAERISRLTEEVRGLLDSSGRDSAAWLGAELNNARMAGLSMYESRLPAFRAMLAACDSDLNCFYENAESVSTLSEDERNAHLDQLASGSP